MELEKFAHFESEQTFLVKWSPGVHCSDVIVSAVTSKSQGPRLFSKPFVQTQIKENIKALCNWPLWGESTGRRWIPLKKGQ